MKKEQWIELNATQKKNLVISPIKNGGRKSLIVIGEQLDEDAIRSCLEA